MANNIKIIGNIIDTSTITRYSEADINLISSKRRQELFGGKNDYIEYFVYDAEGNILNINYNYLDYKLPSSSFLNPSVSVVPNTTGQIQTTDVGIESTLTSTTSSLYPIIEIDPIQDLQDLGYSSGEFNIRYNFFETKISNFLNRELFVKEISRDRTEIRLGSVDLTDEQIESGSLALIDKISNTEDYYVDYILNFGNNQQYVAVNVALNKDPEGFEILFKLYQPLPLEVQEKQTLWVVEEKVIPYTFNINLDRLIISPPPPSLRGPNFDIELNEQGTISTAYTSYSNLIYDLQSLQNSSYNQIQNLLATQSIDINVDYTNFNNFVFFGSAYRRVVNFYNKVKEIEDYQNFITLYTPFTSTTSSLQTTVNQYSASINNIISQFDGYEYYLYFESSSYAWPKSGSLKPFSLLPINSATVNTWYNNLTESALQYDEFNYDNLEYAVPSFVKDDSTNQPFLLFLNMVGHYFDNIWIYLKAVTDINLANNNLNYGISRDLVYQQLKSLGIKLYNSQAGESVDNYLIGANTGSVLWNDDFSVTSSYLNNIPRKDLVAELYKRIYHNLPLLVKTKGTVAGLNNLMTIFGISNRDYYTIFSGSNYETFYTPTGSLVSSSILNVKEFGGSLKSNLIDGYNNDKVRIVSNTITGSVLSPLLSLQTSPTASLEFRDDDLHYIDISFSPQTQIDTYTSKSIASNNPTWSLDDYIGDPHQLYDGSYPDLDAQRTLYYQTGVPGYPGFTSSLLDYNGFIRLIEFFDNSLFKMLNDFVPERTSLSTGVTINSPVLERNKAAYSRPTVTTQSVYEANYDIAEISSSYGTFYNALAASNNTKAWYDGNISGSVVDINQYFEDNYNPYLQPTSSLTPTDINFFNHSDWNVLLNNVSKSVDSQYRKKIEYFYGTTSSITYPAELQDSYLSLRSYNTSRYDGSKITSLLINTYTSASYTGSDGFTIQNGDRSFGKTAAIDLNVRKIGLFTRIETSSFLPNRNNVSIKYLVDEFGSLTELNQLNKHWIEVQNTFVAGDYNNVSLFDNKKYSNQKTTDGNKLIFDSGYTYSPILYGSGSDERIYFQNTGETFSFKATSVNFSSSYYLSGSSTLGYPISGGIVTNLFNFIQEGENYMSIGGLGGGVYNSWPSYSVQEPGDHLITATFDLTVKVTSTPNSMSFTLAAFKTGSGGLTSLGVSSQTFTFLPSSVTSSANLYRGFVNSNFSFNQNGIPFTTIKDITLGATFYPRGSTLYRYPGTHYTSYSSGCNPGSLGGNLLTDIYSSSPTIAWQLVFDCYAFSPTSERIYQVNSPLLFNIPNFTVPDANVSLTKTFSINIPSTTLVSGDKIQMRFTQSYSTTPNYTASFGDVLGGGNNVGTFTVRSLSSIVGNNPYAVPPYFSSMEPEIDITGSLIPPIPDPSTLVFSSTITNFYSDNYQFYPQGVGNFTSSLYNVYGDIDYPFQFNQFDIFVAYYNDLYFESRVKEIYYGDDRLLRCVLVNEIPIELRSLLTNNGYVEWLFLKQIEDETNMYLTFNKRLGQTSYGFIIPNNLAPDVLANIDTITKEVKQKLLADQQGNITP